MGKGYNNFMSKKTFHPGSFANQKRIREAEVQAEAKRKHDEDTLAQYQKEQELFNQKSLVSKLGKDKLSLNFMYEAPAGVKKEDKQGDKVEWMSSGPSGTRAIPGSVEQVKKSETPNICLEWKRERPARQPQQRSIMFTIEQSSSSLKSKVRTERESDKQQHTTDVKRIKKER